MMLLPPAGDRTTIVSLGGARDAPGMVLVMIASPILPRVGNGMHLAEMRLGETSLAGQMIVQHTNDESPVIAAMPIPISALETLVEAEQVEFRVGGRRYTWVVLPERDAMTNYLRQCLAKLAPAAPEAAPVQASGSDPLALAEAAGQRAAGAGAAQSAPVIARSNNDPLAAAEAAGLKASQGQQAGADATADAMTRGVAQAGVLRAESDTLLMMMRMNNHLINGGSMADPNMGAVMWGLQY